MKPLALSLALVAACATTGPAERVTLPQAPPPGAWRVMRATLLGCAAQEGLSGPIEARVSFDPDGTVSSVGSGYGDGFARCVGDRLLRTRFRAERGRTLLVAFTVEAPLPVASCETAQTPCEPQGPRN